MTGAFIRASMRKPVGFKMKIMKELKDYIHLYLGCKVCTKSAPFLSPDLKLIGISDMGIQIRDELMKLTWYCSIKDVKLILRPLGSMIEQEAKDLGILNLWIGANVTGRITWGSVRFPTRSWPKALNYGFDLFDLQAAGLAIYKT